MSQQRGFFDEQERLEKLSNQGDPLEKLNAMMDWKIFRPLLRRCFKKKPKGPGGRPPFDYVLMFKILILQRLYNLSDAQMQFQIWTAGASSGSWARDCMRRCRMKRPFGSLLGTSKHGLIEKLFTLYRAHLEKWANRKQRHCSRQFCGGAGTRQQSQAD